MDSGAAAAAPGAAAAVALANKATALKAQSRSALNDGRTSLAPVFAAGATAGLIEGICVQPLEFMKTRLQLNEGKPLPMTTILREALREGGVAQLYRGALPELTGMVPRSTGALASLEFSKRLLRQHAPDPNTGRLQASHAYAAGAISGVCESLGFAPFQVIKVRMVAKEHLTVVDTAVGTVVYYGILRSVRWLMYSRTPPTPPVASSSGTFIEASPLTTSSPL
ncbi:hypothetical protein Vretimale_4332 [Volvox reticuliferus]|uniref:Uncharacterized protein n=1 Tax=Volvox reticuliferus TaxID=1737510 RepID=A0A8J4DAQ5_9CHLO|nr:hypothetical protein Vretimale_4332 [Volvox reticuliferus]